MAVNFPHYSVCTVLLRLLINCCSYYQCSSSPLKCIKSVLSIFFQYSLVRSWYGLDLDISSSKFVGLFWYKFVVHNYINILVSFCLKFAWAITFLFTSSSDEHRTFLYPKLLFLALVPHFQRFWVLSDNLIFLMISLEIINYHHCSIFTRSLSDYTKYFAIKRFQILIDSLLASKPYSLTLSAYRQLQLYRCFEYCLIIMLQI